MTLVRDFVRRWSEPAPACGAQIAWGVLSFKCDRPEGHLPTTDHSVTLRWTTKP